MQKTIDGRIINDLDTSNKQITIFTQQWYDAAHHLENYDGACKNLHGHTYRVDLWVRGNIKQLDKAGILYDFGNLKKLTKLLDHCPEGDINNVIGMNSTAENQVIWFFRKLKNEKPELLFKVRVYEQLQPKNSYAEIGDFE